MQYTQVYSKLCAKLSLEEGRGSTPSRLAFQVWKSHKYDLIHFCALLRRIGPQIGFDGLTSGELRENQAAIARAFIYVLRALEARKSIYISLSDPTAQLADSEIPAAEHFLGVYLEEVRRRAGGDLLKRIVHSANVINRQLFESNVDVRITEAELLDALADEGGCLFYWKCLDLIRYFVDDRGVECRTERGIPSVGIPPGLLQVQEPRGSLDSVENGDDGRRSSRVNQGRKNADLPQLRRRRAGRPRVDDGMPHPDPPSQSQRDQQQPRKGAYPLPPGALAGNSAGRDASGSEVAVAVRLDRPGPAPAESETPQPSQSPGRKQRVSPGQEGVAPGKPDRSERSERAAKSPGYVELEARRKELAHTLASFGSGGRPPAILPALPPAQPRSDGSDTEPHEHSGQNAGAPQEWGPTASLPGMRSIGVDPRSRSSEQTSSSSKFLYSEIRDPDVVYLRRQLFKYFNREIALLQQELKSFLDAAPNSPAPTLTVDVVSRVGDRIRDLNAERLFSAILRNDLTETTGAVSFVTQMHTLYASLTARVEEAEEELIRAREDAEGRQLRIDILRSKVEALEADIRRLTKELESSRVRGERLAIEAAERDALVEKLKEDLRHVSGPTEGVRGTQSAESTAEPVTAEPANAERETPQSVEGTAEPSAPPAPPALDPPNQETQLAEQENERFVPIRVSLPGRISESSSSPPPTSMDAPSGGGRDAVTQSPPQTGEGDKPHLQENPTTPEKHDDGEVPSNPAAEQQAGHEVPLPDAMKESQNDNQGTADPAHDENPPTLAGDEPEDPAHYRSSEDEAGEVTLPATTPERPLSENSSKSGRGGQNEVAAALDGMSEATYITDEAPSGLAAPLDTPMALKASPLSMFQEEGVPSPQRENDGATPPTGLPLASSELESPNPVISPSPEP